MIKCWRCQGAGEVLGFTVGQPDEKTVTCPDCKGVGIPQREVLVDALSYKQGYEDGYAAARDDYKDVLDHYKNRIR